MAGGIVELLFDDSPRPLAAPATPREDLIERIVRGGFPEAGVEVKASATVRARDFRHLATLRDRLGGERFLRGVVLYPGEERLPFGERLEAWPLATLWSPSADLD